LTQSSTARQARVYMATVIEINGQAQLEDVSKHHEKVVLNFWAVWCEPCKQMNAVFDELAKSTSNVAFVKIEAEKQPEISEKYDIKAVPCFIFQQRGSVHEVVEGADPPTLTKKIKQFSEGSLVPVQRPTSEPIKFTQPPKPQPQPTTTSTATASAATKTAELNKRLEQLINSAPVMLFMKGVPTAPRCGFSSKIVNILNESNILFEAFDILSDNVVREGLKTYSNWPTYPQLYISGKLVGGLDIVKELKEEGELAGMVPPDCIKK